MLQFLHTLANLPGNVLQKVIGVLPHDDSETGKTSGYTDNHFTKWCESMGGKDAGNGLCSFEVKDTDYKQIHNALYSKMQEPGITDEGITGSSAFIDAYNQYLKDKQQQ